MNPVGENEERRSSALRGLMRSEMESVNLGMNGGVFEERERDGNCVCVFFVEKLKLKNVKELLGIAFIE